MNDLISFTQSEPFQGAVIGFGPARPGESPNSSRCIKKSVASVRSLPVEYSRVVFLGGEKNRNGACCKARYPTPLELRHVGATCSHIYLQLPCVLCKTSTELAPPHDFGGTQGANHVWLKPGDQIHPPPGHLGFGISWNMVGQKPYPKGIAG